MATIQSWNKWGKGLLAAVIGGAANAACASVVDPAAFGLGDLTKLGKLALASGVISMLFYLKQSPLPPEDLQK